MNDLPWIAAKRSARLGVASSQLFMRHWSPEFYTEKCWEIEKNFKAELQNLVEEEKKMSALSAISVERLREAARAWRQNDVSALQHWLASGPFRFLAREPNLSLHDRIDDMIAEIERLRKVK